jgi:N4-gp56 family major capsid protein
MVLPGSAGQFTSVADSATGLSKNLVQTAYDLVLRRSLNNSPILRHFVTVRPQQISFPGSSIVMQKFNYFSDSTVTTMKAALAEEGPDVAPTKVPATSTVTITAAEHGAVVTSTKYFEGRSLAAFTPFIAEALADSAAKVVDELIQDQLESDLTEVVAGGGALSTLDKDTAGTWLQAAVAESVAITMLENNVPTWDGNAYVAVAHPRALADLRGQAGATGWRIAKEYGNDSVLKTLPNEVGQFDGIRYVSNNRVRKRASGNADGTFAYNAYFFGQGGLAEHVVTDIGAVVAPQVDNLRRFNTIGWYGDLGWKVYEPLAVTILQTATSRN